MARAFAFLPLCPTPSNSTFSTLFALRPRPVRCRRALRNAQLVVAEIVKGNVRGTASSLDPASLENGLNELARLSAFRAHVHRPSQRSSEANRGA
jgi:hypothetical protein